MTCILEMHYNLYGGEFSQFLLLPRLSRYSRCPAQWEKGQGGGVSHIRLVQDFWAFSRVWLPKVLRIEAVSSSKSKCPEYEAIGSQSSAAVYPSQIISCIANRFIALFLDRCMSSFAGKADRMAKCQGSVTKTELCE